MPYISCMGIILKVLAQGIIFAQQCKSMHVLLGMGEESVVFGRKLEYL